MKTRKARLVEFASDYCICYWNTKDFRSGTIQTVRMAQKKGIEVINLFEMSVNSIKSPNNEKGMKKFVEIDFFGFECYNIKKVVSNIYEGEIVCNLKKY